MLIEFSVENFLSFDERVTFSMEAIPEIDAADGLTDNTFEAPGGRRLIKSALIFGANASGKSNLIDAVVFASMMIVDSAKNMKSGDPIDVTPFRKGPVDPGRGSTFAFAWLDGEVVYEYEFSADPQRILAESLRRSPADREEWEILFTRDAERISVAPAFPEGAGLEQRTRPNALFLSLVALLNGPEAIRITKWFVERLMVGSGLTDAFPLGVTLRELLDGKLSQEIVRFVQQADLGIAGLSAKELTDEMLPGDLPKKRRKELLSARHGVIKVRQRAFDRAGQPVDDVEFDLDDESQGTRKFIALAGPLLLILREAGVFFLDELDARLHPRLTAAIVELFHSAANVHDAQLVGVVHDTNLLDRRLLRSDQIWFTQKDRRGATKLYSLAEFDLPKGEPQYERDYLLGKFGGVPAIGTLVTPEAAQ